MYVEFCKRSYYVKERKGEKWPYRDRDGGSINFTIFLNHCFVERNVRIKQFSG